MPHLVDFVKNVPFFHGFLKFRRAPCASEDTLLIGMGTDMTSVEHGLTLFFLDTGGTQGKGQFTTSSDRQDGMK